MMLVDADELDRAKAILQPVAKGICGEEGTLWISSLEDLIHSASKRWGLIRVEPVPNITYNFVAFATRADGSQAVLKIGIPDQESPLEIRALEAFGGESMVRMLDCDRDTNTTLLERAEPGTLMESIWTASDDEEHTLAAAHLIKRMCRLHPSVSGFPHLRSWFDGFEKLRVKYPQNQIPGELITKAVKTYQDLLASASEERLLHGDFHHGNVILHGQQWIGIDPKGVVGELAYEPATFIRNPHSGDISDLIQLFPRRIEIFAEELGIERSRVAGYAFAHSVLSLVWDVLDFGTEKPLSLAIPIALEELL